MNSEIKFCPKFREKRIWWKPWTWFPKSLPKFPITWDNTYVWVGSDKKK